MIEKFLKAKHWQLFILWFGLPMAAQVVFMVSAFSLAIKETQPDIESMFGGVALMLVIVLLAGGILMTWYWSLAMGLQSKIPEGIPMKTQRFTLFFFFPVIYIACFIGFFAYIMLHIFDDPDAVQPEMMFTSMAIIVPFHLFAIFCMFHTFYFVAKTIKTVELQRPVKFDDFIGEFFLIWFYVIGVWIIQPKINKIMDQQPVENPQIKY